MKNYILAITCLATLTACAATKNFFSDADKARIEARADGVYAAIAADEDKADATAYASAGAKAFCEKKGKTAVSLKTTDKYSGLTSEKGDKLMKKAGDVAMMAGAGRAAVAADTLTDDASHEITMEFRCE